MAEIIYINGSDGETIKGSTYIDAEQQGELYQQAGFHHIPEASTEGILIYIGQGHNQGVVLCPKQRSAVENLPGETVIYSVSGGEIQSKIVLTSDGNITLNGDDKRLVTHAELDQALQALVNTINIQLTTGFAGCQGGAGAPPWVSVTLDISQSETQTIKTGG